ncbi:MAG: protein kinase [bacterium]|nr:protein kinase [bacterium]
MRPARRCATCGCGRSSTRALSLGETLEVAAQVAEALDYSHSQGVIHRDVKPENLMLCSDQRGLRVLIMDFGLARDLSQATSGGFKGTAVYMSPEQILSCGVDGRTDFYALGTVLYECLAGEPPFRGKTRISTAYQIVHDSPRPLRDRGVDVDEELEGIVLSCLAKDPSERPATGELADFLRGYGEKLAAEKLTEAVVQPPAHLSALPETTSPRVGCRSEWRELEKRLRAARDGECQLALIGGDVGAGKARLLEQLEEVSRERGLRVLRGRIADRESTLPFQGLCELIQDYFRSRESPEAASETADVTDLAADLVAHFPTLGEIAELRRATPRAAAAQGEAPRQDPVYLYELLARTLARLGGGKPMVLLVENLHAGDVSIMALDYIVRRLGPTPTLIAGTYQSAEIDRAHPLYRMRASFAGDRRVAMLELGPLAREDFRQWVEWLIGPHGGAGEPRRIELDDELVETLYETTTGNRFFTQEMVRALLESDGISRDQNGLWTLSSQTELERALPATIKQTVAQRVDYLPEEPRQVLRVASVLGKRFDDEDLEALVGAGVDLDRALEILIGRHFLKLGRGDQLSYTNGVIREVLYQSLRSGRRRELHRRHAEQLEARFMKRGRLEQVYPRLVEHFAEGEVADKTVNYALELARKSLAACCPEEAIHAVRQALKFVDELPNPDDLRAELWLLLARAHRASGDLEQALEQAAKAFSASSEAGAAAAAALLAAETAWQGRQGDEARRWVGRGAEPARRGGAAETLRRLLTLGATVAYMRCEHEQARRYREEIGRLTPQDGEEPVPEGRTLVTVLPNPVASLDPAEFMTDEEREVEACVFETLFVSGPHGDLSPALAERWHSSSDSCTFELVLRSGVTFSDRTPLTAHGVKASLERAARRLRESPPMALEALVGFDDFQAGRSDHLAGIEVGDASHVTFRLVEALPIFPSILTHPRAAIVREIEVGDEAFALLGTGPFRIARQVEHKQIVLERSPGYWRGTPARLKRIVFHTDLNASEITAGLRAGEIDLGRDLLPEDLEMILRDPAFRSRIAESVKKNVYFILFNNTGPVARDLKVRQALLGVIKTQDLVWRTLGRFAQPAVSLIPPGILGHDPGRRERTILRRQARQLLAEAGHTDKIELRAAVHPLLQDRYVILYGALLEEWSALGVEVSVETPTMESFLARFEANDGIDLWIGRWNAPYDDPDIFTYGLFHSEEGVLRRYYSSPEADQWMIKARQEKSDTARRTLYHRLESLLAAEAVLLPLFHDVDYRIASPRVHGLSLRNTHSYVNYAQLGVRVPPVVPDPPIGAIRVAIASPVETLDPAVGSLSDYHEVIPNVFETLTRVDEGARIMPWLADARPEKGATAWRFRLREGIRFHDGRRLDARDVRFSFERLLRKPQSDLHYLLLPIRGARALRDGEAGELDGLHIVSATEILFELERPLSFFDALLSSPTVAIVPEGSEQFSCSWHDGCAGTGAFRVVRFDPGEQLVLERNPLYWRADFPKSERLVFYFGWAPDRIFKEFVAGRLSLATGLRPADTEALFRDQESLDGYLEAPRLATYFVVPNIRRGPFTDVGLRRAFAAALDVERVLRETGGQPHQMEPASGLIPPLLLGAEEALVTDPPPAPPRERLRGLSLQAILHPAYAGAYAPFWEGLHQSLQELGLTLEARATGISPVFSRAQEAPIDLYVDRWLADYPDPDGFVGSLLHSEEGALAGLFSSAEIDRRIEQGRRETDPGLRRAIYWEIEEILAREALLIPLFHEQTCYFTSRGVEGLRVALTSPEVRYEELAREGC